MRLLLDTHLLLWAALGSAKLPAEAHDLIVEPGTEPVVSAASLWEIAIKNGLGRADFKADPHLVNRGFLDNGYAELPVTGAHAMEVGLLPLLHGDPFDRILIAQARVERIVLLTADKTLARYAGPIHVL